MMRGELRLAAFGFMTIIFYSSFICIALAEQTENVIHNFQYDTGNEPFSGPVRDGSTGALYGVTANGGANGVGVVYQLVPPAPGKSGWRYKDIYDLSTDTVLAPLPLLAVSGNVYLVADEGGTGCGKVGCGQVLELTPSGGSGAWTITVLHQFSGGSDGNFPISPLVMDSHGDLYGVAAEGGTGCKKKDLGCGVLYEFTRSGKDQPWVFSVAHLFSGGNGLAYPRELTIDAQDNLYGLADTKQNFNKPVVYRLAMSGGVWNESILYRFYPNSHGCGGVSSEITASASGALYGIGTNSSSCVSYAFQLAPSASAPTTWVKTTMRQFTASNGGAYPTAPLTVDSNDNVYGTLGGANIVYALQPRLGVQGKWNYKVLFTFDGLSSGDGDDPVGGVVLDSTGAIYGTTEGGGAARRGVLYRLSP